MPGSGGLRIAWVWKDKLPLYWLVLAAVFFVCWLAFIFDSYLLPLATAPTPSGANSHALTVGGGVRYMNPLLWWCYDKGGWICGALFLLLLLITFLKRDQLERVR